MIPIPLSLPGPALLLAVALIALARPGPRPGRLPLWSEAAALAALLAALAAVAQLVLSGPLTVGPAALPLLRLDAIGATLTLLVSFVGWVVIRFSRRALDGEPREGRFHALTLTAVACVLVLVQAASLPVLALGLIAVGAVLRQLLLFYPDRPAARRVAAKFTLAWGAGTLAAALGFALLWQAFGTADIAALGDAAAGGLPGMARAGVALVVLGALLMTAAFPLHGWLTEVMEAPTPVSALLHAGIINAGGVLLITLSEVIRHSPGAMAVLVALGGLTALFGAVVMLTQSAVKTALAWSTVAQMGFMLMQCGLGLWALALLHVVAHSLYKAHAFLSSGGAVQAVAAIRRPGPVAVPGARAVGRAFALALMLYAAVAAVFVMVVGPKTPQALALGAMLIFGVAYLIAQGLADAAPGALTRRTAAASLAAALAYFGFQTVAQALWGPSLPAAPVPGALEWALIGLAVLSFGAVALAQALFPLWGHHPSVAGMRVHLANGLYVNAALDRITGGFRTTHPLTETHDVR